VKNNKQQTKFNTAQLFQITSDTQGHRTLLAITSDA